MTKRNIERDNRSQREFAPQLDRIEPAKGYVEGNVVWLSRRANNIKGNATRKELEAVLKWIRENNNGC